MTKIKGNSKMPIVQIHMLAGRTTDQKRALADKVTKAICETANTTPEQVKIIISDMAHEDYSVGGVLHADKNK
jgi:4-oxalocrotonate tautomerase